MADLLERDMEDAVARCPSLFIESGLELLHRQIVINGRRPDLVFQDGLSRHLLVELQRGRLDEEHLQRHVFYFYDYRAKYTETHPRLLFLANRVVPQHKEFLDDHGYEYKEIPENEFLRRMSGCTEPAAYFDLEVKTSPGVLPLNYQQLLYAVELQPMTLCYKMLLLLEMIEHADSDGRVSIFVLANGFQKFFQSRSSAHKSEENPRRFASTKPSERSLKRWETIIRDQPVRHLGPRFVIDRQAFIQWAPEVWTQWSPALKNELKEAATRRLVAYFNRHVPGGY
jgi:Endonuclease NucS